MDNHFAQMIQASGPLADIHRTREPMHTNRLHLGKETTGAATASPVEGDGDVRTTRADRLREPLAPGLLGNVKVRKRKSKKRLFFFLFAFSLVGIGVALWWWTRDKGSIVDPATLTTKVVRRDFASSVLATGAVKPQVGAQVRVGARISGKVEKLISQSSFVLKGTGWYQTDYADKKKSKKEKSETPKPDCSSCPSCE